MSYTQHKLSAVFPAMSPDELQAMRDSIEDIGVQNPVTLFEGQVIDGWHRYTLAASLGLPCPMVELDPEIDPRAFVLAQNKNRRHVSAAQLALIMAEVYQFEWAPPVRVYKGEPGSPIKTVAQAAKEIGVAPRTIQQAKALVKHGSDVVKDAVRSGEIGLKKANVIAKLPLEQQAEAIRKPIAKPAREPKEYSLQEEPEGDEGDYGPSPEEIAMAETTERQNQEYLQKLLTSDDALATATAEVKRLNAENAQLKIARDGYMREAAEAKKLLVKKTNELDRLRKSLRN